MPTQPATASMAPHCGSCASVSCGNADGLQAPAAGLSPTMMRFLGEAPSITARISLGGRLSNQWTFVD
ncbi:hypothetical protein AK830_g911 [Neonectria ditissima]|uniref:Uncharacterized protein n=1 Tax=Neonectria ditissima TaxID=78410 RepID=A0A0P7BK72_9HYPO|nr:hypothetical protein AK830_g911 [Neonectria ditissima]